MLFMPDRHSIHNERLRAAAKSAPPGTSETRGEPTESPCRSCSPLSVVRSPSTVRWDDTNRSDASFVLATMRKDRAAAKYQDTPLAKSTHVDN